MSNSKTIRVLPDTNHIDSNLIEGTTVAVIDILRATSVICTALKNNAKCIIPVEKTDSAKKIFEGGPAEEFLLGGERAAKKIAGFHLGNSPLEYTQDVVEGKSIILTTTNGTKAIEASTAGETVLIASFLNLDALCNRLIELDQDITIVCAGTNGFFSMDDALCAGAIVDTLTKLKDFTIFDLGSLLRASYQNNKHDLHKVLENCQHYNLLNKNGFNDDLQYCIQTNTMDIVPEYINGKIKLK